MNEDEQFSTFPIDSCLCRLTCCVPYESRTPAYHPKKESTLELKSADLRRRQGLRGNIPGSSQKHQIKTSTAHTFFCFDCRLF